jgi:nitroimidazol reductase NimA-like FMN-containing flavoprotein (pyridoxamine 5'-phosphate oxidase superfamily)
VSPRESIAMSIKEMSGFLQTRRFALLATVDVNGAPDATLTACSFVAGSVTVHGLDSLGQRAAETGSAVALAFEQCPSYYEIRGVTAHGRLEMIETDEYRLPLTDVMTFDFAKIQGRP